MSRPLARTTPVDRSRLPDTGHARAFQFPVIAKSTLPNGLRVWSVHHASVPIVTCTLLVRSGSASDPADRPGLAALTADMLDEGSGGRSAIEMHEALARLGAQFDTDIGPDAVALTVTMLSRFVEPAMRLLADMAVRPSLVDGDFDRVRQLRLHRLKQLSDLPAAVAERVFARLLYGAHPYGHTPIGSEASLQSMTVEDVRAFHQQRIVAANATLIAVGDCDHASIERAAVESFGGWAAATGADVPVSGSLPTPPPLNIVPRPGAPQSELRIGHVAAARSIPDYHALVAANMVLGGQFVSRINLNLREDKGLTYGARTTFDFRRMPGPFALQVSVDTAGTARAVAESLQEIAAIRGPRPITPAELALGVAALTRGYARSFETAEQIARALVQIALYDLSDTYFQEFVPRLEQVTPEEASRVAARYLDPARLTTLIIGDVDAVKAQMAGAGLPDLTETPAI